MYWQARGGHAVRHWAIEANSASFPVVEQGEGPAVLFLHGFPDTMETRRSQMQTVSGLAAAIPQTILPSIAAPTSRAIFDHRS